MGIEKYLPLLSLKKKKSLSIVSINSKDLWKVIYFFKKHSQYQYKSLSCISCTDFPSLTNRFIITYELLSVQFNRRLRIKINVNEATHVHSVSKIFICSDWWEREIWDMFGVFFYNHPDLRRILTDYGFLGYPLRKDFPLTGFTNTFYDNSKKRVSNNMIELSQEYRLYDYSSPWSQM